MCQTSFLTYFQRCGHSILEDHRCEYIDCDIESTVRSTDQNDMCHECNENRQEELALSRISPRLMTRTEAQRIQHLYSTLRQLPRNDGMVMSGTYHDRHQILQRAMFNIPVNALILDGWSIQDLETHAQALLDDINRRGERLHEDLLDLEEIRSTLGQAEYVARDHLITAGQRQIEDDYRKYDELRARIDLLNEQERETKRLQRIAAIPKLLEPVKYEDLSIDEADRRCNICMEAYIEDGESEAPCKLPCGHIFGEYCVTTWFEDPKHDTCCICRHNYWKQLGSKPPARSPEEEADDFLNNLAQELAEMDDRWQGLDDGSVVLENEDDNQGTPAPSTPDVLFDEDEFMRYLDEDQGIQSDDQDDQDIIIREQEQGESEVDFEIIGDESDRW